MSTCPLCVGSWVCAWGALALQALIVALLLGVCMRTGRPRFVHSAVTAMIAHPERPLGELWDYSEVLTSHC